MARAAELRRANGSACGVVGCRAVDGELRGHLTRKAHRLFLHLKVVIHFNFSEFWRVSRPPKTLSLTFTGSANKGVRVICGTLFALARDDSFVNGRRIVQ